jgi:hypothetical protein
MDIGTVLIELADKLGIAVEEIFKIYTGVQWAFGILTIICAVSLLIITILLIKKILEYFKEKRRIENDDDNTYINYSKIEKLNEKYVIYCGLIYPILICLVPFIIWFVGSSILQIYYPQYFAIENLLHSMFPS